MQNSFYGWFRDLVRILTDLFFIFIPVVTLYVFTSVFEGYVRYIVLGVLIILYLLTVCFAKDRIRSFLSEVLKRLKSLDERKMMLILVLLMTGLRIIYTLFFDFDATVGGDTGIYSDIADQIIATGTLHSDAISHLFAVALHFVVFKLLHIPIRHGMFLPFFFGTVINFLSFKEIIGKEKAFLLLLFYLLMPSTILYSFCPTHEVFFYFYLSAFLYFVNRLLKCDDMKTILFHGLMCTLFTILAVFINPVGYIIYVILLLICLLSRTDRRKKIILIVILLLALLGSRFLDRLLEVNEYDTTTNTYTILIHGSNPTALGEQVDGYPREQARTYMRKEGLDFTKENYVLGLRAVLIGQYRYLLTHPLNLLRLIIHKYYILWSGDHYPIEMAHVYGQMSDPVYYILLTVSTLIYLFMVTAQIVYKTKKVDKMDIQTYKLTLLGIFGVTMLSVVLNKYGVYVTSYLYLIAFYETELSGK